MKKIRKCPECGGPIRKYASHDSILAECPTGHYSERQPRKTQGIAGALKKAKKKNLIK